MLATDRWTRVVWTMTAQNSGSFRPIINLGLESSTVWIDDVHVYEGDPNIFRRDFDNGVVVANATSEGQTIDLGENLLRIQGTQDPINNGAAISTLFLPPYDAAILVRPENQSAGAQPAPTPPTTDGDGTLDLVSAMLPSSRSVRVGTTATMFATLINNTDTPAVGCRLVVDIQGLDFSYKQTDPATNAFVGDNNPTVTIAPHQAASFVVSVTPSTPLTAGFMAPTFNCDNKHRAPVINGVNTVLFSASATPVPDMIAIAVTPGLNDGVLRLAGNDGAAAFSIATTNLGAAGRLEVTPAAQLRGGSTPLALAICQTSASGGCIGGNAPSPSVTLDVAADASPTFAVFTSASGTPVPFDPAENRIFLNFSQAGQVRGGTSVAVTTQ